MIMRTILSDTFKSLIMHLANFSRDDFNTLNNFINGDPMALGMGHQLNNIAIKLLNPPKGSSDLLKIQNIQSLNESHAKVFRDYPNTLKLLFKLDSGPIITHILEEAAPSPITLLEIIGDYALPENIGRKIRNEVSNIISNVLGQPVSLPPVINQQFINFINTYKETIRNIFKKIPPDDPKILLLKQQYIPDQDAKSILALQEDSQDPKGFLDNLKFGNLEDKEQVFKILEKKDPFSIFFIQKFIPAFQPQSNEKVYIYDIFIWGYYNQDQFYAITNSKRLNRQQVMKTIQNQTLLWMTKNLDCTPQNISMYEHGKFPDTDNGKDGEDFLQIRNLNTSLDLVMESNAMNHCAGSYHQDAVAMGEEEFYSVQDRLGRPFATIVLKKKNQGKYYVSEIRGRNNSRPDQKYMLVAGEWLEKNGIEESDSFKTGWKNNNSEDTHDINYLLNNFKFGDIQNLIQNKKITPQTEPEAFWTWFAGSTSDDKYRFDKFGFLSFHPENLILNKTIEFSDEPILFNFMVFGNAEGIYSPDNPIDKESFKKYVMDKINKYFASMQSGEGTILTKRLDQIINKIDDYTPLVYEKNKHDYPEEAGEKLYEEYSEQVADEHSDEWEEEDSLEDRVREEVYNNWDYSDDEGGPLEEDVEQAIDEEKQFGEFLSKEKWIEINFPWKSFAFSIDQLLVLKGIIRPGNPVFKIIFDELKNKKMIHREIKNWVLKGSAISRNPNYIKYYHELADHWLSEANLPRREKYKIDEFNPEPFASLAIYSKSISRLDGIDRLRSFISKMNKEDSVTWGYNDYSPKDIIRDGIVSRLDYPSDKDAKLDFVNLVSVNPIDSFLKDYVDNDILPEVVEQLLEFAITTPEDQRKFEDIHKKYNFISDLLTICKIILSRNVIPPEKLKPLISIAAKDPHSALESIEKIQFHTYGNAEYDENIFKDEKKEAVETLAFSDDVDLKDIVQTLYNEKIFQNIIKDFPELHSILFKTTINYLKEQIKKNDYRTSANISSVVQIFKNSDYGNYLDETAELLLQYKKYYDIINSGKLHPQDPKRITAINEFYKENNNNINQLEIFITDHNIYEKDGDIYYEIMDKLLSGGCLFNLISNKIITLDTPILLEKINNNPQEFVQKSEKRTQTPILIHAVSRMFPEWGQIYQESVKALIIHLNFDILQLKNQIGFNDKDFEDLINKNGFGDIVFNTSNNTARQLINYVNYELNEPLNLNVIKYVIYNNIILSPPESARVILFNKFQKIGPNGIKLCIDAIAENPHILGSITLTSIIKNNFITEEHPLYKQIIEILIAREDFSNLQQILTNQQIAEIMEQNPPQKTTPPISTNKNQQEGDTGAPETSTQPLLPPSAALVATFSKCASVASILTIPPHSKKIL